jgi:hypothetical protein
MSTLAIFNVLKLALRSTTEYKLGEDGGFQPLKNCIIIAMISGETEFIQIQNLLIKHQKIPSTGH